MSKCKIIEGISRILNDEVNPAAILEARRFLQSATVDDVVILFVAGHGLYGGADMTTYYYLTHRADLKRLEQTAVDFDTIESLLQGIAPLQKLFLLDTCQSGGYSDDASETINVTGGLASRGIKRKPSDSRQPIFERQPRLELGRYIYNDLYRRSGAIVLSSSRGSEFSYESDDLQNGVFTEAVLQAQKQMQKQMQQRAAINTPAPASLDTDTVAPSVHIPAAAPVSQPSPEAASGAVTKPGAPVKPVSNSPKKRTPALDRKLDDATMNRILKEYYAICRTARAEAGNNQDKLTIAVHTCANAFIPTLNRHGIATAEWGRYAATHPEAVALRRLQR